MEKNCRFSYNEIDDSLIISCKEENEKVKESFMFDNFIFSLTGKGKVVALQIRNVSTVLEENKIDPEIIPQIKSINLITAFKENSLFIGISLIAEEKTANIPLRVFVPQLVSS